MAQRITYYRDPLNEQNWIVAEDNGDASEETVLREVETHDEARAIAERIADKRGIEAVADTCEIN